MERPDDAAFRLHVEIFALLRRLLPVAILVGAFAGPMSVAEPSVAMWYSVVLFCVSLFVLWTLAGLPLYPAHTFGIEYRFEDESLESDDRSCVRCERAIDDGVHRRYARQIVVLGVPCYTLAWGENDFCRGCFEAPASASSGSEQTRRRGATDDRGVTDDRSSPSPNDSATVTASRASSANSESATQSDWRLEARPATGGTQSDPERDNPGTAIARRLVPNDETTALELRRAFDEDGLG